MYFNLMQMCVYIFNTWRKPLTYRKSQMNVVYRTLTVMEITTLRGGVVFNTTFNNFTVISWLSVLLVEETRLPKETTDLSQVTDKLHILCCIEHTSPSAGFKLTTLVVICTDCTGKFNCDTIMTSPKSRFVFFKGLNNSFNTLKDKF